MSVKITILLRSYTLRSLSSLKTVYITSPREVDVVFHVQADT